MKVLLDTCLLSELVKTKPDSAVLRWMKERTDVDLYVSAMTIAEIERGIAKLPVSRRRADLAQWLKKLIAGFENRVLAFTLDTSSIWAQLCANVEAKGKPMAAFDSIIAATALEHGLPLVTRNVKDFDQTPLILINPWSGSDPTR